MGWLAGLGALGPGLSKGLEQTFQHERIRQQLAQEKQQAQARTLAGLALLRGGLPGFGPSPTGGGMTFGGPTPPAPGAPSVPMIPPMPQSASTPAAPPQPSDQGQIIPGAPIFSPPGTPVTQRGPGNEAPVPGPLAPSRQLTQGDNIFAEPLSPPATPQQQQPAGQQQAQAPSASDTSTSDHVPVTLGNGQQFTVPELFRVVDPQALAQAIGKASPGADPAAIYEATADLLKLSNGNKNEQLQAAYLGRILGINMQIQGRREDTQARVAAQERGQDITARGQDIRSADAAAGRDVRVSEGAANRTSREGIAAGNRDAATQRMLTREGRIDARQALREADTRWRAAMQQGDRAMALRIQQIRAQIAALVAHNPGSPPSTEDQKKIDELAGQLVGLQPGTAASPPAAPSQ